MKARRDRQADIIAHRAGRAAEIIPTIRQHLAEQRHYARFNYCSGDNEGGRSKGTHSDPTATLAVYGVGECDEREARIDDALATLNVAMNLLERECSSALGYRVPADQRPSDGRTAFEQDGEPICHAANCDQPVASYRRTDNTIGYRMNGEHGGLCDAHRMRARREVNAA